jgi:hypothetical protein
LSKRLADCQEEKDILSEERSRLRTGTALLQERIHSLEDQFSNAEIRFVLKLIIFEIDLLDGKRSSPKNAPDPKS